MHMLRRKFEDYLLQWKRTKGKECLLVKGARQVGKTYSIRAFGEKYYQNLVYLNFYENPEFSAIFDGSLEPDVIYRNMSLLLPGVKFEPHDTLIFLDEIQQCPNARTALKFLALDDRYDVIASSSLLGILYRDIASIPVGYERQVCLRALDFEEFLWALGVSEETVAYLKDLFERREKVPDLVHGKMLEYLRTYMVVGGMPAVVNTYLATNNFNDVHDAQQNILNSYQDDVLKYAGNPDKPKIKACFDSIPRQLAKEHTKFQYTVVHKGDGAKKYGSSIDWLVSSNIVACIHNVSTPLFPLKAYEKEEQFKVYVHDIGLLIAMYGYDMKAAILHDTLTGPAKGGIYENLILCMLLARNRTPYYYKAEHNSQEIEFLLEENGAVVPVEVKAHRGKTVSLNAFQDQYHPPFAYKLVAGNAGEKDAKVTVPLYMAMFL